MVKDCKGIPLPVFCTGIVENSKVVDSAFPKNSVFLLTVVVEGQTEPAAGQFYMLRAEKSDCLMGRPISIFHSYKHDGKIFLEFLILQKGTGTKEICSLRNGDKINLLGPCGNRFEIPVIAENKNPNEKCKICIVGGGIGIAPVAGFAETLTPKSYDFYASFKSGSYGLENIDANKLVITTDDGSVGMQGMLPVALTSQVLKDENYDVLYACGPTPMLAYLQKICIEAGVKCFLSMESRMACGVGVCLGCVIDTTEGKKRCCKDGPIFPGEILIFAPPEKEVAGIKVQPQREPLADGVEPDLSVNIAGVHFKNPVIASSGTFGFGTEYASVFDVNRLGGISSKGLTLEPRQGNDGIRLHETPSALMNSIGLQNPGIPHFIKEELPAMMKLKPVTIANLSGTSLETYTQGAILLDKTNVPIIELNISCPNVSAGGSAFGMSCASAQTVVSAVRKLTKKPLIVKLTPQSPQINEVALACIESGADGISLCNSFQGIAVDIERGVPVFDKLKAGFGGPAVRPIAVRLIYELVEAINSLPKEKRVPVIAIGGIATWQDAVEFIMVGADAIAVGTATFANPNAMIEIIDGITAFMKRKGYNSIADFKGIIQKQK